MRVYPKAGRIFAAALVSCILASSAIPFRAVAASAATGSIVFSDAPGTSAPPSTLGPYLMTPFPADTQAAGTTVSGVAGPTGTGTLGFSPSLDHELVGQGWATWSNGYSGDVYATSATSVTLSLPSSTKAFYLYAEPEEFMTFSITATSSDGTTSGAVPVAGEAGAEYFGFYATGSAALSSITVSGADPDGFAVGEFGISNGLEHFVVNAEAWIPYAQVVDPYLPVTLPYLATKAEEKNDPNCYTPPGNKWLTTFVSSTYGGDSHTTFGTGTYRLRTEVSFDFDPTTDKITNFTKDAVAPFGTSHRYKVYTSDGAVLDSCVEAANTTNNQTARTDSNTSFTLGYQGTNPLAQPVAPALTATISGTLSQDGSLTLTYKTTDFPSQGIQVSVNGTTVATDLENDVSCLGPSAVLGFSGLALLGLGLNLHEQGSVSIQPYGSLSESTPSPICQATTRL